MIIKAVLITTLLIVSGCKSFDRGFELSGSGPAFARPAWIKSPEAILGTINRTWGLDMNPEDRWDYLGAVYPLLGGTSTATRRSPLDQPHEIAVLGLYNLSRWSAKALLDKQVLKDANNEPYLFSGLGLATSDDHGCFADDSEPWCDFEDGITVSSLSSQQLSSDGLSLEMKKRLMHNIQDIGEFFLLNIDNELKVEGTSQPHAAAFLLEEVFLPAFTQRGATAVAEKRAWEDVVTTILMSGGFFLEAPAN